MPFTNRTKVGYYDCDASARMKLSAAMRCLQQTSGDQLDMLDLSYEKLYNRGLVFLLSKSIVTMQHMPLAGQEILVSTVPVGVQGARFYRDMVMDDTAGNRLLSATTVWMLVDPQSRKILRPNAFPYELPYEPSIAAPYITGEKLAKPQIDKKLIHELYFPILYSHIDNNGHVNNSYYFDFACNIIPQNAVSIFGIQSAMVQYHQEALIYDTMHVQCYILAENSYYISGTANGILSFEANLVLNSTN